MGVARQVSDTLLKSLVQAIIGLGSLALTGYLLVSGQEVPSELYAIITLVLGFYFGVGTAQGGGR